MLNTESIEGTIFLSELINFVLLTDFGCKLLVQNGIHPQKNKILKKRNKIISCMMFCIWQNYFSLNFAKISQTFQFPVL